MLRDRVSASTIGALYDRISPAVEVVRAIGGAWRHGTRDEYVDHLEAVGFTNVDSEDVTGERAEPSVITRAARAALLRSLADRDPVAAETWRRREREHDDVRAVLHGPDYRVVQFSARRPSV